LRVGSALAKKEAQERAQCPLCYAEVEGTLRSHIIKVHGEEALARAVLADRERGVSDPEIGRRYGISFGTLEQIATEAYGANVSVRERPKRIKRWHPQSFRLETTTVWSFKQRGDWATHDGRYRGNWSPYIPRNIILRYSKPGETVLDYFVGGGTTAIEAELLGRRCIARDINPEAIRLTRENLQFAPPRLLPGEGLELPLYEPEISVGDARDLSGIPDGSVDLICAHPPYAGIIKYSSRIPGDLSALSVQDFLAAMREVAEESLRVLKPGGKCAILIGDARKAKHVVPIGFETIRVFLDAGFILRELVIKRQHNCRTTGFWYTRSLQYNFLLLAHEYLPIFEKPLVKRVEEPRAVWDYALPRQVTLARVPKIKEEDLETTTVWVFSADRLDAEVRRNLLRRFAVDGEAFAEVQFHGDAPAFTPPLTSTVRLLFVRSPERETEDTFTGYRGAIKRLIAQEGLLLPSGGFLVLEAKDFHVGNRLVPAGLLLWEDMSYQPDFSLKEVVIVASEEPPNGGFEGQLDIAHRYLLVYRKAGAKIQRRRQGV